MAKARPGSRARRDHGSIARAAARSGPLVSPAPIVKIRPLPARPQVTPPPGHDGRLFDPRPALSRPYRRVSGQPARVVAPPVRKRATGRVSASSLYVPAALLFSQPRGVAVCVRRKERREVIFATRKAGANRYRPPKSNVRC